MKVVFEMVLYMYLYQSKLLQMAATFRAHCYCGKFNFWNKWNCYREILKIGCWDNVCLFVFVCLFSFCFRNSLFCRKKRLYVSSNIIECLYSYLTSFFSESLDSEIGQVLGYSLQYIVLRFHLFSLYKKRQNLVLSC